MDWPLNSSESHRSSKSLPEYEPSSQTPTSQPTARAETVGGLRRECLECELRILSDDSQQRAAGCLRTRDHLSAHAFTARRLSLRPSGNHPASDAYGLHRPRRTRLSAVSSIRRSSSCSTSSAGSTSEPPSSSPPTSPSA